MGGDRDGNPNVTALVTKEVVLTARIDAASLYFDAVEKLMMDLSLCKASPDLNKIIEASELRYKKHIGDATCIAEMRRKRGYRKFFAPHPANEPYRKILSEIRDRLWETRSALYAWLGKGARPDELRPKSGTGDLMQHEWLRAITSKEELLQPLRAIHASLIACGDGIIADGPVADFIRQVSCFGLGLNALDVRQESTRHAEAMHAICMQLGLGHYSEWTEEEKVRFLEHELGSTRPLIPIKMKQEVQAYLEKRIMQGKPTSEMEVLEVLATFATIAELPLDSFGTYVISMAQSASDVLCVRLLQKEFGVPEPMLRVAPLFETLDDLQNAPSALRTLLSSETYRKFHVAAGVQEVMIGYSDSGKDAGRLAAAWAQYEAQEQLVAVAKEFDGVDLVFFHGRGGTVGRGGGPLQMALRSQPAGTIKKGRMRVTVQGETIERQFGVPERTCQTLDMYLSAMVEAELCKPASVKPEWRVLMQELQKSSCDAYRSVVFQDPRFIAYFRDVTPSAELGRANIGSRPAKRKAVDSVGSIRAIPWIFAWTQTRFNLPVCETCIRTSCFSAQFLICWTWSSQNQIQTL